MRHVRLPNSYLHSNSAIVVSLPVSDNSWNLSHSNAPLYIPSKPTEVEKYAGSLVCTSMFTNENAPDVLRVATVFGSDFSLRQNSPEHLEPRLADP